VLVGCRVIAMTNMDIIWTINREYRIVELFRGRSRAPTGRPPAVISSGTGINSSPASCKVYRNFWGNKQYWGVYGRSTSKGGISPNREKASSPNRRIPQGHRQTHHRLDYQVNVVYTPNPSVQHGASTPSATLGWLRN